MSQFLIGFKHINKEDSYHLLSQICSKNANIQFKFSDDKRVFRTKLKRKVNIDTFYFTEESLHFKNSPDVTIKIEWEKRLFFLKTNIRMRGKFFYFDRYDNVYELVRRRSPRFNIPRHWPQDAYIQAYATNTGLKSEASIIEMSQLGMKLRPENNSARFEKGQLIKINFKIFRRTAVIVIAKIIHVKKQESGATFLGVEFTENDSNAENKIRNYCDDLAFYHAAIESLT
jgi:c-di-GMP-binding flagellar brake protein YcgR